MSAYGMINAHPPQPDMDFCWIDRAADKAAALTMVRASVYLALSSAEPEEIFATIDAVMLDAA